VQQYRIIVIIIIIIIITTTTTTTTTTDSIRVIIVLFLSVNIIIKTCIVIRLSTNQESELL